MTASIVPKIADKIVASSAGRERLSPPLPELVEVEEDADEPPVCVAPPTNVLLPCFGMAEVIIVAGVVATAAAPGRVYPAVRQ